MVKYYAIAAILLLPALAHAEDTQQTQPPKPANICHTNCQPLGNHSLCSKHCWSYKGGPGSVLVQTTVTWTSGQAVAKKAGPTPVSTADR